MHCLKIMQLQFHVLTIKKKINADFPKTTLKRDKYEHIFSYL